MLLPGYHFENEFDVKLLAILARCRRRTVVWQSRRSRRNEVSRRHSPRANELAVMNGQNGSKVFRWNFFRISSASGRRRRRRRRDAEDQKTLARDQDLEIGLSVSETFVSDEKFWIVSSVDRHQELLTDSVLSRIDWHRSAWNKVQMFWLRKQFGKCLALKWSFLKRLVDSN